MNKCHSYQHRSTIFQEMQKRIQHWIQRAQQMSEEHQTELEMERERRKNDLHQQSEDHRATVETIRYKLISRFFHKIT